MAIPDDPLDATTLDSSAPTRDASRGPVLHVVHGSGDSEIRELSGECIVGRKAPPDGWSLAGDGQASRHHARLAVHGKQVVIEDPQSRNGISVNGVRVPRAQLNDRDVIRVGSTFAVLRFEHRHQLDVPVSALVGHSAEMREVRVAVLRVAKRDATVLLLGETGSGKEVVARAIHQASRRAGPYLAVNCAGVQESLFESELFGHTAGAFTGAKDPAEGYFRASRGGTLLLDEIGDMPVALHAKLLRVLETGAVVPVGATQPVAHQARVIAATNRRLVEQVDDGSFRSDLYARLAQLIITLPPLRDRREDILPLFAHIYPDAPPLAPNLVEAMLVYDWPRNVRELVGVATELRSRGDTGGRLELEMVRGRLVNKPEVEEVVAAAQEDPPDRAGLEALLREFEGNVTKVARAIGRSRTQAYRLIERHGLDPKTYRSV